MGPCLVQQMEHWMEILSVTMRDWKTAARKVVRLVDLRV